MRHILLPLLTSFLLEQLILDTTQQQKQDIDEQSR